LAAERMRRKCVLGFSAARLRDCSFFRAHCGANASGRIVILHTRCAFEVS
jgi:hypothetical protein